MLKLILSLVIVFCSAIVGLYCSQRLRRRIELLSAFETLFERASIRISYNAGDLCEVFSDNFDGYVFRYSSPFPQQWEDWIMSYDHQLKQDELLTLKAFADGLGASDTQSQQRHIDLYRGLLHEHIKAAENAYQKKGKLYRVLPISLGLVISILII